MSDDFWDRNASADELKWLQFDRYGSVNRKLYEALECLDIANDDMHHGRVASDVKENLDEAIRLISELSAEYEEYFRRYL